MNFLTPEALAFAATLPVVVVFYLLKRRRVARLVSSTVLWKRFLNETQASSPFQKLRHNWLLVIQLILLALAVFALTRPYFAGKLEGGRFIVAILDVSASMQATDISPNRLDQAKAGLAKLIDSMYDNDRMVLLLAGAVTEVRQSPTSAKPALRSALGQARATDSPTRLLDAIKLAQNLTRNRAKTEVHLFSDGASPDLDEFELQDLNLAYHRVGEDGDNLGIVSLEVRPHPEQVGQQAVFATVANASTNPLASDVSLFFGDRLVGNRRVSVGATNTASLVFVASLGTNGVFRLQLKNSDVFAV
ncbi:MAG TPA: BatA and WFA domain-containing protein, partial [Verrucomicrobiota bacterium]|nr:BatA and WFA domain-containing protein [Verrucomicrobiota bacterium]